MRIAIETVLLLAASIFIGTCNAITTSQFEVDLIFPRNETYTPVALLPVVFAIQNPSLALPLDLEITWGIAKGNFYNGTPSGGTAIQVSHNATSVLDPYFVTGNFYATAGVEGSWVLQWSLGVQGCSAAGAQSNRLYFTTKDGGAMPDLSTATTSQTCNATEAFAFDVTAASSGSSQAELSTCAGPGSSPTPAPNPCAVTIGTSAAFSLSAMITSSACAIGNPAKVTCPPPSATATKASAAESRAQSVCWTVWSISMVAGLMAVLAS